MAAVRRRAVALALGVLLVALLTVLLGANLAVRGEAFGRLYATAADAPIRETALVPGAEVYADGRPSPALASRLEVAVELHRLGRVRTLLLSGGQGSFEVDAMTAYLRTRGIPGQALVLDPGGERTYDSCRRAVEVYGVRSAIVVSQAEHAARAVFTCRRLGLDAVGVVAEDFTGERLLVYRVRERLALVLAWWESFTR